VGRLRLRHGAKGTVSAVTGPTPAELARLDATAQADLVRTGEATPTELVDGAIARIEAVDPQLNAVIHRQFDAARAQAAGDLPDGPFRGVPFLVKDLDNSHEAGQPYHGGTRYLQQHDYRPAADSELIRRYKAAGLVITGRTNCPELGLQPTTEPATQGATHNPWDPTRSPGGSSGGSAAAVASGLVPMAHAGDGGGSIRIPASACGLVGLKPSKGRHTNAPENEAWAGLVARNVVSRSVRDTAAALDVIAGPASGDPYQAPPPARPYSAEVGADAGTLRVGWIVDDPGGGVPTEPACADAVKATLALLEAAGHRVEESAPEGLQSDQVIGHFTACFGAWTLQELGQLEALVGEPMVDGDVEPGTAAIAELGQTVTAVQYLDALDALHTWTRGLTSWWEGHDVLVLPTMPVLPTPLGAFAGTPDNPLEGLALSTAVVLFTAPFNISGQPAISLPLHWTEDGLPVGVQLVAAYGREDLLIRVAAQLEVAAPWAGRTPPIFSG
jgi:amidase